MVKNYFDALLEQALKLF